jgi:hypothetical protein
MLRAMRALKRRAGGLVRGAAATLRFFRDYRRYVKTGQKEPYMYTAMRSVYVLTNGRSSDLATWWSRHMHRPVPIEDRPGIIDPLTADELTRALVDLERDGIHIFSKRVHSDVCEKLIDFARSTPCKPHGDHLGPETPAVVFDPANVIAPSYWFDAKDIAGNRAAQLVFLDPSIRRLAQRYLQVQPILDIIALWWSAPYGSKADSESAQMFHFDLDRLKFLKFFIYLTDVSAENGPHVLLRGTHVRKPRALLRDGRIPDEEVYYHWPKERALEVGGPRGTLFAADTRAFHKGKPVAEGNRLVLQLQFTADLYGHDSPFPSIDDCCSAEFLQEIAKHPRTFSMFARKQKCES